MARTRRTMASPSPALTLTALGVVAGVMAAGPAAASTRAGAGSFTRGEGAGHAWCAAYGGQNIGSYQDIYACKPDRSDAGKTPFDTYSGFQPTELANRFLFKMTGRVLFDNEVGGNFVALASAAYAIPDASAGAAGVLPKAGDIISMWGGRSGQKQGGNRTLVAVVSNVTRTPGGWRVTTLNQGEQADTTGTDGFNTIAVSDGGRAWTTEYGFYRSFDWLLLQPKRDAGAR